MTPNTPSNPEPAVKQPGTWTVLIMAALLVVGLGALWLLRNPSPPRSQLPARFDYDMARYAKVDPRLVRYRQAALFPIGLQTPRAIAVGPGDAIHIAGDQAIVVLDAQGQPRERIDLDAPPSCLAVDAAGNRFVGFKNYVSILDDRGKPTARWQPAGPRAVFTSIAVDENDLFVADAGNKCVIRYDRSGRMIEKLAQRDAARDVPGLVIPSAHCDVALGADGLLRVVNPGQHRIELFTRDGHYEAPLAWGLPGTAIDRFCGCCNPVAIALLPDDRVVTAEKAVPRVKVYSPEGHFECVVAAPQHFGATQALLSETRDEHKLLALALATDRQARGLVLDPAARAVRVFVVKEPQTNTDEDKETTDEHG